MVIPILLLAACLAPLRSDDPPAFTSTPVQVVPVSTVQPDGSTITTVPPGHAWLTYARAAKPGDQIVLQNGFHVGHRLEGLHGTREKPIVIRGADPTLPAAVACEEYGIELSDCSWIRLENLYFMNPRLAAVLVEGSAERKPPAERPDVSISLAGLKVALAIDAPAADGIRIRNARNVGVVACRFEGWGDAAVEVDGASGVVISQCSLAPTPPTTPPVGIAVRGGSESVVIFHTVMERGMRTGVRCGECGEGDAPAGSGDALVYTPSPADAVRVDRCMFLEIPCPVEFGPGRGAAMTSCTVVDPATAWRVDALCGTVDATVRGCLFTWTPGILMATCERRGDAIEDMVRLESNLWWSPEVPAVFEVLGRPFGLVAGPQILDVDPRLSDRTFSPSNPAAQAFGWTAGTGAPAAPASGLPPGP